MKRTQEHERTVFNWMEKRDILKACNGICTHCGKKITDDFTVEHVIPLSKGGSNDPENLVALCETCNTEKSNQIIEPKDYYRHLPKARLKQLQATFEQFCVERDWLTEYTLFRTDQFKIKTDYRQIQKYGLSIQPTTFLVTRLSRQETLEFMHAYVAKNGQNESTPTVMDEIKQEYYKVTHNGKTMYVFTGRLMNLGEYERNRLSEQTAKLLEKSEECRRLNEIVGRLLTTKYYICVDVFTAPEVVYKGSVTTHTIQYTLSEIGEEIGKTLKHNQPDATMRLVASAANTDIAGKYAINDNIDELSKSGDIGWLPNAIGRPRDKYKTVIKFVTSPKEIQRRTEIAAKILMGIKTHTITYEQAVETLMKSETKQDRKTERRIKFDETAAQTHHKKTKNKKSKKKK